MFRKSVAELGRMLATRKVSALELARLHLERLERHRDINAFLDVRPEVTLAQARAADDRIAKGESGVLTGVPIAHKDIFVTRDFASTAASRVLEGYMSPFDATVVEKLSQAGMVTLGKIYLFVFALCW
jgi:aspartyl-tRNA(Asn)/glutamyl-tRNA(Gln) amidotransferase subunit A